MSDLTAELQINRTVAYRLLTTLQRHCLVIKSDASYLGGPALIRFAEGVLPGVRQIITPAMQRLSKQTRETVSCAVRDGSSWVVLDQVLDNYHAVHVREEAGSRYPLHLGAHGHALMAAMSEADLAKYYSRTKVSDGIRAEITTARHTGFARSKGELRDGIEGIAAAGMIKEMPFSLALIVPSSRSADIGDHLSALLEAVSSIDNKIE